MASASREKIIRELREEYMNRRGEAFEDSQRRKLALYDSISEMREIDALLAMTATNIMSAVSSGEDIEAKILKLRDDNKELRSKRADLLVRSGYPADYTDIKYECEKCSDTGYIGIEMCPCMKTKLAYAMLEESGLGALSKSQSFENFDLSYYSAAEIDRMKSNFDQLKDYAETFSADTTKSWLLYGNTGLGKTHLSTAVAKKVIDRGYEVCYQPMQAMVDDFADCQFRGEGRDSLQKYYEADLLIIDDLGVELVNQFTVSSLYNIINYRMNNGKPMIISTNLTQEEIREKYMDRVTSRLFGMFHVLLFKGTDIRRQKLRRM